MTTVTPYVFLCHSSVDAGLARLIVHELEEYGVQCWIAPRDVDSGVNYPRQLVQAISGCDTFVALVTESSARSDHVLREVEQAVRHRRRLLPIVLDGASSADLDYYFGALHRITGGVDTLVPDTVKHFASADRAGTPVVGPLDPDPTGKSESDVLRVGVIPWPPFSFHGSNGGPPGGIYVDLLDQFAVETGIAVRYVEITNDATAVSIENGSIDVVACLCKTPARERNFDFAACLFATTIGAVVRFDESRIASHGDLMKPEVRMAVARGEVGAELAVDLFGAARGSERLLELDTTDIGNLGKMVVAGVADAAITDSVTCRRIVDQLGPVVRQEFQSFPLYVGHIGLLIGKGRHALKDHLSSRLRDLRAGETLAAAQRQLQDQYAGLIQVI